MFEQAAVSPKVELETGDIPVANANGENHVPTYEGELQQLQQKIGEEGGDDGAEASKDPADVDSSAPAASQGGSSKRASTDLSSFMSAVMSEPQMSYFDPARVKELNQRIEELEKLKETLDSELVKQESETGLEGIENIPTIETEHTAELKAIGEQIDQLHEEYLEAARNTLEMLRQVNLSRRLAAEGVSKVFERLFELSASAQNDLDAAKNKIASNTSAREAASEKQAALLAQKEAIQRKRCLFFGCVDVHPPHF